MPPPPRPDRLFASPADGLSLKVTAGADTNFPQTQIVYDPIYDHNDGVVASRIA
jgi:hypothetical protein